MTLLAWTQHLALDGVIVCADVATGVAFAAVLQRMQTSGSAEGLSLQTLVAAVTVRLLHLGSHSFGLHYKPIVLPGAGFYSMDVLTALAGLASLVLFFRYRRTYESSKDNFGIQLFSRFDISTGRSRFLAATSFLYLMTGILAVAWHHIRYMVVQEDRPAGFYMSFYECMGALCYVPQLWMFHQDKRVPPLLARFVVAMAVHKLLVLVFWGAYPWVAGTNPPNRRVQMVFDTLSLFILADFIYYWARSKLHGYPDVILDSEIPLSDLTYLVAEANAYEETSSTYNGYLAADVFG